MTTCLEAAPRAQEEHPATPVIPLGRTVTYLAAAAISMVLPIFTLPITTRWLAPEDYGLVALGQVMGTLFMGLANLGMSSAIERNFFKYEASARALATLMHTGLASIACGILVWGAAFFPLRDLAAGLLTGQRQWGSLIWALSIGAGFGMLLSVQLVYLRNRNQARRYLGYSIGGALLESALAVGLLTLGGWGVWGLVAGQLLGKVLVVGALWMRMARELPPRLDVRVTRELLEIGLPLTPKPLLGIADMAVDRVLINWLNSLGQVGLFGLANRAGYGIFALLTSLGNVYVPQAYRFMFGGGDDVSGRLGRFLSPYCYASLAVPVAVILFSDEALRLLVAPSFYGVRDPLIVLAAYYGQMFFGKVIGAQLLYRKRMWYATPLAALRLALHFGLAMWWIPRHGALGAALALFVTGVLVDVVSLWVAHRVFPIAYELHLVLPMVALLYAALAWVLVPARLGLPYGMILAGKMALFAVWVAIGARWAASLWGQLVLWGAFRPAKAHR